jgi:hypothetical protein
MHPPLLSAVIDRGAASAMTTLARTILVRAVCHRRALVG